MTTGKVMTKGYVEKMTIPTTRVFDISKKKEAKTE